MIRSAEISGCGLYRYRLTRSGLLGPPPRKSLWDPPPVAPPSKGSALWVMLNPSTADGQEDDNTIRKVVKFTAAWGYDEAVVVNLDAYRATDPKVLLRALKDGVDIVGPDNDSAIARADAAAAITICAWGCHEVITPERVEAVGRLLAPSKVHCLHVTKYGAPGHPLYLSDDSEPMPWKVKPEERPQAKRRSS